MSLKEKSTEQSLPNHVKVAPFIVFYLIHSMQVGSGLLGFTQIIAKHAGYDAWMMVIIAGGLTHISLWMIIKIVETVNGDLVSAHTYIFGDVFGNIISVLFIGYFILQAVTAIRSYVEIVQVWVFPEFSTILFIIPLLMLVVFIVGGGLKTVGGVAFFGAILPVIIYFTVFYSIKYAHFQNLLPVMDHSWKEMTLAGYWMSLSYIGFEALLIYYPFINKPQSSKKWAHLGLIATTLLYIYFTLFTFAYFSEKQLGITIWPTLTMWKVVEFPLIERFEYIGIAIWLFMMLPNICISIWAASRLCKRVYPMRMRTGLYFATVVCLFITPLFKTTVHVEALKTFTGQTGFIVTFAYVPLLLILLLIRKRAKSK